MGSGPDTFTKEMARLEELTVETCKVERGNTEVSSMIKIMQLVSDQNVKI